MPPPYPSCKQAGDSTNAEALDRAIGVAVAAVGIHQHHDAITGTDYANVAEDYVARLARARTGDRNDAPGDNALLCGRHVVYIALLYG